jgi:hypothetical protein
VARYLTVFVIVVALTAAILTVPLIFRPYSPGYSPDFHPGDPGLYTVLALVMILAPWLSAWVSTGIYGKADL